MISANGIRVTFARCDTGNLASMDLIIDA